MIDGGTEAVSGTLGGTIDLSGTAGILEIGSAAIILSSTDFAGFVPSDTIILEGVTGSASFSSKSEILSVSGTALQFSGITAAETFVSTAVVVSGTASTEITIIDNAECFLAGTRIMTPRGVVAVENLEIGDEVSTAAGQADQIEWIGQRSYSARFACKNHLVRPVCIKKNAIAARVPQCSLYVSPGHGIFLDCVLVPAWRLINGKTITQAESVVAEIRYYHIELASHAVILAENCPAETYLDIGSRSQFQNAATCTKRENTALPGRFPASAGRCAGARRPGRCRAVPAPSVGCHRSRWTMQRPSEHAPAAPCHRGAAGRQDEISMRNIHSG